MKSVFAVVGVFLVVILYWVFDERAFEGLLETSKETAEAQLLREGSIVKESAMGAFAPIPKLENVDVQKARLGRDLFLDARFSQNNTLSCNSCHSLQAYGSDNKAFSVGINGQFGDANSPTVFNSAGNFRQFWDGRAASLAEQVEGPIHNAKELGSNWPEILAKLSADPRYSATFQQIYGRPLNKSDVVDAIVVFESSLSTPDAPFDRFLRGDHQALSESQQAGFAKFQAFGCVACHQGVNLGGNMYQTLGIMGDYFADRGGSFPSDVGRFAVTKDPSDMHVFRVPSLRNVGQTAPYFHAGQVATLEEAVHLMAHYQLGRKLSDEDVSDLVSFLHSLTGRRPEILTDERSPSHAVAN